MQKMIIVSVRDKKAEAFHSPYVVPTEGVAIRAFGDAVMNGATDLSSHPEDFNLFKIGSFDSLTGHIEAVDPVSICSGLDFKDAKKGEVHV